MSRNCFVKPKRATEVNPEVSGFTLIEVLASIIMATVFVLTTSQAIAISAFYRIRAQRKSEALQWIQRDFSNIKFAAVQDLPAANCSAVNPADGYAAALATAIITDPAITVNWTVLNPEIIESLPNIVLLNKAHTITRTLSFNNQAPYRVMTVNYEMTDPDIAPGANENNIIAEFYTEVTPDAALACQ